MECSNCSSSSAKLHTRIVGGIEKTVCLCDACYKKLYLSASASEPYTGAAGGKRTESKKRAVCTSCGMTIDTFLKGGLLGCAQCYSAFRDEITVSIKYCQRNGLHRGKKPDGSSELKYDLVREQESFRSQMDDALLAGDRALAQELFYRLKEIQGRINREEAVQEKMRTDAARYATTEEDD